MDIIRSRVQEVSNVVNHNTQVASQSADIANDLAYEVRKMNEIVNRK